MKTTFDTTFSAISNSNISFSSNVTATINTNGLRYWENDDYITLMGRIVLSDVQMSSGNIRINVETSSTLDIAEGIANGYYAINESGTDVSSADIHVGENISLRVYSDDRTKISISVTTTFTAIPNPCKIFVLVIPPITFKKS